MIDFNHNGKDDIQEIIDGFTQFKTDLAAGNITAVVQDGEQAWSWLKGEIAGLAQDAQTFFNWALTQVRGESTTLGEAVANMLTLLNNGNLQGALGVVEDSIAQLKALSTAVIEAAVGLFTGYQAAAA